VAPIYALGKAAPALSLGVALVVGMASAAFLLPVRGAHRRIREEKRAELARVRAAIGESRDRALAADNADRSGGRLADLVAYEQRIAGAGEWPFGVSTVVRFALYTAIGLGSWSGAALVERLLESALD
jgi:hypothetical protein